MFGMKRALVVLFLMTGLIIFSVQAAFCADGTYDAEVTTDSGTYTVQVEVEDGEVTYVEWPDGGDMSVYGAELDNGEASGTNSRGDSIDIEIDDYNYEEE